MGTFSKIKGCDSIDELKELALRCFPNINWENYVVYEMWGEFYAVTMHSYQFEVVVSKKLIRYCTSAFRILTQRTSNFCCKKSLAGFDGGSSRWDDAIVNDFENTFSRIPYMVRTGDMTGYSDFGKSKKVWKCGTFNTLILLLLLFCNETRFTGKKYS